MHDHQVYWNEDVRFHSTAPLIVLESESPLDYGTVSEEAEMLFCNAIESESIPSSRCSSMCAGEIDSNSNHVLADIQDNDSSVLEDIARSSTSMDVRYSSCDKLNLITMYSFIFLNGNTAFHSCSQESEA